MTLAQTPTVEALRPEDIWPDPIPLSSTLLPVKAFEPNMLPSRLRGWVIDVAQKMNVPIEFVGVPAMIAVATLIGRRVGIKPEVHSDWTEAANLWGAIIGPPGTLKSPAVREAFSAIRALEKKVAAEHEAAMEQLKPEQMLYELEAAQAKSAAKRFIKAAAEDPFARADALEALSSVEEPKEPLPKRYVTNDATPEKLGELCRGNPDGLLIHRDELLTMFTELEREERAAGRGMIMSGWTGLDGYTVDRIGRGTVRIDAVNLSLFGTAQPNRLTAYMRNSFALHDDGLVQRIQLLVWPDMPDGWVKNDRPLDDVARAAAMACFDDLVSLDLAKLGAQVSPYEASGAIPFLRFAPAAQAEFDLWRETLENRITALTPSDPWRGHISKYRGLAPRLALICHVAGGGTGPVSTAAWDMAEYWIGYLESHALRAYDAMRTDNTDTAQRLAAKIIEGALGQRFTARDVYRPQWSGLKRPDDVGAALRLLVDYDWLSVGRVVTAGKPKEVFTVNPKVQITTLH